MQKLNWLFELNKTWKSVTAVLWDFFDYKQAISHQFAVLLAIKFSRLRWSAFRVECLKCWLYFLSILDYYFNSILFEVGWFLLRDIYGHIISLSLIIVANSFLIVPCEFIAMTIVFINVTRDGSLSNPKGTDKDLEYNAYMLLNTSSAHWIIVLFHYYPM